MHPRWKFITSIPNGRKYFYDLLTPDGIAIADNSGVYPDQCEDGILYIGASSARPIRIVKSSGLFAIAVISDKGVESCITAGADEALFVAQLCQAPIYSEVNFGASYEIAPFCLYSLEHSFYAEIKVKMNNKDAVTTSDCAFLKRFLVECLTNTEMVDFEIELDEITVWPSLVDAVGDRPGDYSDAFT